jgi:hypothetical protein
MKTQPVIAGLIARWLVTWLASKGFELNLEQAIAVFGGLELLITPIVWKLVTPNSKVQKEVTEKVEDELLRRSTLPPGTTVGILFLLVLAGCAGSQVQTEEELNRQLCYTGAELHANAEVQKRCAGVAWEDCPERPAILAELSAAYRRCP